MTTADAIRNVTAAMQRAIDSGERSRMIDANDLIDILLAIADAVDPPFDRPQRELVAECFACPGCGERDPDRLIWQDKDLVQCHACGIVYEPGRAHA